MMRPSPPLPNPSELARPQRVTRRIWDDEVYNTSGAYGGRAGIPDAIYDEDLSTYVLPARSPYWADDPDAPTLSDLRRTSPLVTRPLRAQPGFPYALRGQDPVLAKRLLLFAAIGMGVVLVAISVAFGFGLLTAPGDNSAQDTAEPPPVTTTAPMATTAPTATGTPLPAVYASYASQDSALLGAWQTQYGSSGYVVVGDTQQLPPAVQVTPAHQDTLVWQSSTSDPRALQKASSPTDRVAACWYGSSFTIDVNVTDGQTYQVALYFLDWDQQNRAEILNILDPTTNAVLDTRSITSFANGQYLVWNVRGHVTMQITASPNSTSAVVSGLFIAPVATPGSTPAAIPASTPPATVPPASTPAVTPAASPSPIPTMAPAG